MTVSEELKAKILRRAWGLFQCVSMGKAMRHLDSQRRLSIGWGPLCLCRSLLCSLGRYSAC